MVGRCYSSFFISFFLLTALLRPALASDNQAPILDGAVFEGIFREMGADSGGDDDRLIFQDGFFTSEACLQYGFAKAPYSATKIPDGIRFQATSISPSHGVMTWEGVRSGDRMSADVKWVKERWYWTTRREYQFNGTLVEPE